MTSTLPTLALVSVVATVCFVAAAVSTASTNHEVLASDRRRRLLAAGVVSGLAAAVWVVLAAVQIESLNGTEPAMGGWGLLAPIAGAFGLVPYFVAARPDVDSSVVSRPEMPLTTSQSGVWIDTIDVTLFFWVSITELAAIVLLVLVSPAGQAGIERWLTLGVLFFLLLISSTMARVRVRVDSRGLQVASSIIPFIRKRVPLATICAARTEPLEPASWGGWGYRVMPGRSALLLFSGPGLNLDLANGKSFSVSLRHPRTPAALVNGMKAIAQDSGAS
ncbi:MAG: hypothetical protein ACOH14_01925 [Rhodoglobus sp.]